jgi:hypothetical protein
VTGKEDEIIETYCYCCDYKGNPWDKKCPICGRDLTVTITTRHHNKINQLFIDDIKE